MPRLSVSRAAVGVIALLLAIDLFAHYGNSRVSAETATAMAADPAGLAAQYPGDVGIENDPAVVFVDKFEDASPAAVFTRWTDILNGAAMSLTNDVPPGSPGTRSLTIPWIGGGVNNGGHLYKRLAQGIDDTLYVRYYIKYPTSGQYSHNGIWVGGYNPALSWPNPQAGVKPVGNDRFSASAEQRNTTAQFDHYNYWMNMHQSNDGSYWGNELLNNPQVTGRPGQWMCVEHMVKLNNPVSASNGEHAIWLDGVKISHLGLGFPTGTWAGGNFNPGAGAPFEGFRWRSDANLKINYLWLQNYSPYDPAGFSSAMKFDHVVAATRYVGCLAAAQIPPAAPTNVRVVTSATPPAPAPVATVTVAPATASILRGATQQFSATLKDAGGNVLTGRAITWTSSGLSTATVSATGLVSGVAAGLATITATSEGKSGTSTVTVTALPTSSGWPNEPAGMVKYNENSWDTLVGNGWNFLRRSSTKDPSIIGDNTAQASPLNVLRMVYTPGCCLDAEPSVHWISVPLVKEIFTGYWVKLSSNWIPNPAGGGKISFLFTDVGGQVYTNYYHQSDDATVQGPPYRIGANTEWAPYGQKIWFPNVQTTWINPGEWHRIEFYYRWETTPGVSRDGIIRWWVDGILNGDHRNVQYPAARFQEFQFAPTVQFAGTQERYMYVDHSYISIR